MTERRATTRVTPSEPIAVKLKSSLPARVLDISSGGVQVQVATSLRPQADCELRVHLADGEMIVRAKVRRCRAWGFALDESNQKVLLYRAGLEFSDMQPEALGKLQRFLATPPLEPTPPPEPTLPAAPPVESAADVFPIAPVQPQSAPLPQAPRPSGPVKIRINSEYVRRVLQANEEKKEKKDGK